MAQVTTGRPGPTREWRIVLAARTVALLAGIGLAVWTAHLGRNGQGAMLSMAVFGLTALVGTAIGETVVRPHPQGVRAASLTPRRVRDFLPWTWPIVAVEVVLAVVVLVLTTLTASADASGRAREITCASGGLTQSHSPYPGSFYSLPLALTLAVVLVVGGYAARQVVLRPRGMAWSELGEDRLRRNSLDMVVAASGVAVGAPLVGVLVVAGGAMSSLSSARPTCAAAWMSWLGPTLLLLALLVLMAVAHLLGRLFLKPSPRA